MTYPLVELLTGFVFLEFARSVVLVQGNFIYLFFGFFVLASFIALMFIDLRYFILPDSIVYTLITGTAVYLVLNPDGIERNILGAVLWGGLFAFVHWVTKGKGLGFGDVKLAVAIGLFFGLLDGFFVIYLAVVAGAIVGVTLLILKKANRKSKIPFGSFLSGASIIFILFGRIIYNILNTFI
jgi:leader peptidase (prepilin peptidase)/N-methyltransferase